MAEAPDMSFDMPSPNPSAGETDEKKLPYPGMVNSPSVLMRYFSRTSISNDVSCLEETPEEEEAVWLQAKCEGVLDPETGNLADSEELSVIKSPSITSMEAVPAMPAMSLAIPATSTANKRLRPQTASRRKRVRPQPRRASNSSAKDAMLHSSVAETPAISTSPMKTALSEKELSDNEDDLEDLDHVYLHPGLRKLAFDNPIKYPDDCEVYYMGDGVPAETADKKKGSRWKDTGKEDLSNLVGDAKIKTVIQASLTHLKELKAMIEGESEETNKYKLLLPEIEAKIESYLIKLQAWKRVVGDQDDNVSDLESLLRLSTSPWLFNNPIARSYRKKAHERWGNEKEIVPPARMAMPEYFSDMALPASEGKGKGSYYLLEIAVDPALMAETQHTLNASNLITNMLHQHKTTADFIIQDSFRKYKAKLPAEMRAQWEKPEDFVLKAAGYEAFMYGEKLLVNYEYIRRCIRESTGASKARIALVLARKPSLNITETEYPTNYAASVDADAEDWSFSEGAHIIGDPDAYEEEEKKTMDICTVPENKFIRIKVKSLDLQKFERASECKSFSVEAVFFAGFRRLDDNHDKKARNTRSKKQVDTILPSPLCWKFNSEGEVSRGDLRWKSTQALTWSGLPRSTRLGFQVWGVAEDEKTKIRLGFVVMPFIDRYGRAVTGDQNCRMWSMPVPSTDKHSTKPKPDPEFLFKQTPRINLWKAATFAHLAPSINFEIEWEYDKPATAPYYYERWEPSKAEMRVLGTKTKLRDTKAFNRLQEKDVDPLYTLSQDAQELLWSYRHYMVAKPNMLSKFMQVVDFTNPSKVNEAHRLLEEWTFDSPVMALELLDCKYHDFRLRAWAVDQLDKLPDHVLSCYILQLVQALKYESYDDSPLSQLLVRRSLKNPYQIGHYVFWLLKAELHVPHFHERFALILEEYLTYAGPHAQQLRVQNTACNNLIGISELIRQQSDHGLEKATILSGFVDTLNDFNEKLAANVNGMMMPCDPRLVVRKVVPDKCKYMSSKMVPLWLCFELMSGENAYIMFKNGDDLRQDMLTLQVLRRMDEMWLADSLDMRLKPYEVMATGVNRNGQGVGMIQPVINADTIADIQHDFGGGASGALKVKPLLSFIQAHNEKMMTEAKDNFLRSCAGYLVATYILGIGDRHNGNIMITKRGHLFHIDFGHFLGNFKSKFGIKRERTAFVFTPGMAHVMGGEGDPMFKQFKELCAKGFITLRNNARELEYLFMLMVPAGMPELLIEPDIYYMREKLALTQNDKKARTLLHSEIKAALNSKYRRFDNFIHILKHA